ncbi:SMI1/KNR4 family protein [Pseudomonas sp. P66]|uniref:SMI1/KNR4 family protein n=1 Tax=Pseudomonas arcuscaelestis TaxID=2710591 RepID=A0ABS2BYV0_9PSED|nr:SMI1/KNR4 family protein [Pseudomonas arcuscaelestis]MBM5458807.1 SMI1/KNR4 family protein [Pseudomonas arcuscaelestis]
MFSKGTGMLDDFEDIAHEIGISIPNDLGRLIALSAESNREASAVPLATIYDFAFIDAGDSERMLEDWLGRNKQRGAEYTLLPFGQSGGGDAYCFVVFEDGDEGIAKVMHDQEDATLEFPSVSHWITREYIKQCENLEDLACEPPEGIERMKSEVALVGAVLLPEHRELLHGLLDADVVTRPYQAGRKAQVRRVRSLISQEASEALYQSLMSDDPIEFVVVLEWED